MNTYMAEKAREVRAKMRGDFDGVEYTSVTDKELDALRTAFLDAQSDLAAAQQRAEATKRAFAEYIVSYRLREVCDILTPGQMMRIAARK